MLQPRKLAFAVFEIVYSASIRPFSLDLVDFAAVAAAVVAAAADFAVSVVHLVLVPVLAGSDNCNSAGTALDH
jgi:hypothetical protein